MLTLLYITRKLRIIHNRLFTNLKMLEHIKALSPKKIQNTKPKNLPSPCASQHHTVPYLPVHTSTRFLFQTKKCYIPVHNKSLFQEKYKASSVLQKPLFLEDTISK